MGKIRIKTIGDEESEKKQKEEARKRAEAKRIETERAKARDVESAEKPSDKQKKDTTISTDIPAPATKARKPGVNQRLDQQKSALKHSSKYNAVAKKVDKNKKYPLKEALELLPQLKMAKFDETVELHINTTDKGVSGSITLPHGTGKKTRVTIANQSEDPKAVEELVKKIEAGDIDFDILIATPDSMPKLAKVARILGPRGLMPNPKNGTVTPKPQEAAKKYEGGQMNFKTESKFPLLHMVVGKSSFTGKQLEENIKTAVQAVQSKNIKTATLKSTMSPGIHLDLASL